MGRWCRNAPKLTGQYALDRRKNRRNKGTQNLDVVTWSDHHDNGDPDVFEILLVFETLILRYEYFDTRPGGSFEEVAVPQSRPTHLLNCVDLMANEISG